MQSLSYSKDRFTVEEHAQIERALDFATKAHIGQKRKSGLDYIIHPVAVAQSLVDLGADVESVLAGLLHDTVEDTPVKLEDIAEHFGPEVAKLVDGVTKIGEVDHMPKDQSDSARAQASAENIRKLLLAMAKDIRVIVIKLADRTHNLSTLQYLSPEKQQRIAKESLEIYGPLADRLGMALMKTKIEDISFSYLYPAEYKGLTKLLHGYGKDNHRYLAKLKKHIKDRLTLQGIEVVSVDGRQKHLYSTWQKLQKTEGDITKIHDLVAVRIIVDTESDCYKALGVVHQEFKPLIYRIKDYIAVPKPNGYRSLHTTVFALEGRITEIQIRTSQMHQEAEYGLAAHFFYNHQKGSVASGTKQGSKVPAKLSWVSQLTQLGSLAGNGPDVVEALKVDLFKNRIFVFSPKGDLYDLPEGATAVDFAFAVHTGIGLRTAGARVNGKIMPLLEPLSNRDVVEIITRKAAAPNRAWLNSAKTTNARSSIRAWFRKQSLGDNAASGKTMFEAELKTWGLVGIDTKTNLLDIARSLEYNDEQSFYAALGEGSLSLGQVLRKLMPTSETQAPASLQTVSTSSEDRVIVGGKSGLAHSLAICCEPHYPAAIIGYITRGKGVTVHKSNCANLPTEFARMIACTWSKRQDKQLDYQLTMLCDNRLGLLRDITAAVTAMKINITAISSHDNSGGNESAVSINVEVGSRPELVGLIKRLRTLPDLHNLHFVLIE